MNSGADIGDRLRKAREKLGLGVIQAAERLHVDPAVIDALESEQFSALGPPVFVRGHLRRYAELVGEAEEPLQERYAALQESSSMPDLTVAPRVMSQPVGARARRWSPAAIAIAIGIALVLAAVGWWVSDRGLLQ